MQVQYDLFEENDEIGIMRQEIEQIDERTRNVQRGLFSRYNNLSNDLMKRADQQDERINLLEKQIKALTDMLIERKK